MYMYVGDNLLFVRIVVVLRFYGVVYVGFVGIGYGLWGVDRIVMFYSVGIVGGAGRVLVRGVVIVCFVGFSRGV